MSNPVRLDKKPDKTPPFYNLSRKLEAFILSHASFFFLLTLTVFAVLFVLLCYTLVGVSATESGTVYNHFWELI